MAANLKHSPGKTKEKFLYKRIQSCGEVVSKTVSFQEVSSSNLDRDAGYSYKIVRSSLQ